MMHWTTKEKNWQLHTSFSLLLLDAYNKPQQQKYYLRNDFQFLDNSSIQDVTRLMYFDLIQLSWALELKTPKKQKEEQTLFVPLSAKPC